MTKSLSELKKELSQLKAKNKKQAAKLKATKKIESEINKVRRELKKASRSPFVKELHRFKDKKLTKEEAIKFGRESAKVGKQVLKAGKKGWNMLGKIAAHLDKMNDPVRSPTKKTKRRKR